MKTPRSTAKGAKWVSVAIILLALTLYRQASAGDYQMSKDVYKALRHLRDEGVIGERKTRVVRPTDGVIMSGRNESSVTPLVVGKEAIFGGKFGRTYYLTYFFQFACVGWKYHIEAYVTDQSAEGSTGHVCNLETKDQKTMVSVKVVDTAFSAALTGPLAEERVQQRLVDQEAEDRRIEKIEAIGIQVMSRQTVPFPDPLAGEERIIAGKEVISRMLCKGIRGYALVGGSQIQYRSEKVLSYEFARAEANLVRGQSYKKCVIWALNLSGYRPPDKPNERRGRTWVCTVLSDPAEFSVIDTKVRRILETLTFAERDQNVYPDLRAPSK